LSSSRRLKPRRLLVGIPSLNSHPIMLWPV
jgi:hypothetical protein